MNNERITYEEFMIMFRNAPRVVYTLYDKAEDETDRLNSIIDETIEDISFCLTSIVQEKNSSRDSRTRQEMLTCEEILIERLNKLNELKKEGK